MPSVQEILVVGALAVLVFYLPKRAGVGRKTSPRHVLSKISGIMRLAIVASLLWLALSAVVWRPWQEGSLPFVCWGIGPVVVGWSLYWVILGFRKKR